ncbi:MAG: ribonuclease PH [Acidobacteriota bacterium]
MSKELSKRPHGRAVDTLRPVSITTGVLKFAEGSAQIEMGDTRVLVAASVETRVPPFRADSGLGWVTAEYSMLPRATQTRSRREASRGKIGGRTAEIQRLIGRSLRAAVDFTALGERTITLDCDVLQADGGTRTAAITGAWVALAEACGRLLLSGDIDRWPLARQIAAVSVGIVDDRPLLDLEYVEDSTAAVDLNVVATADGDIVEIQGTGEQRPFTRSEMDRLVDLALGGIADLATLQRQAIATTLAEVEAVRDRSRVKAAPKDEKSLWGPPG